MAVDPIVAMACAARLGDRDADTSTMRSDAAFEIANKAAAPWAGAGGVTLAICGVLAAALPQRLLGIFIFGGVGVFLVCCCLGAATGVRASRAAP